MHSVCRGVVSARIKYFLSLEFGINAVPYSEVLRATQETTK